jgi:hypothetical protein
MCSNTKMESLLRHTVATLSYRLGKVLRGAPADFDTYQADNECRTPVQILAHVGDLMDWAASMAAGKPAWHSSPPGPWPQEVARFFAAIQTLDDRLAAASLEPGAAHRLFQGPIADAFTHTGQLAVLRRMAGSPVKGENYFLAEIVAGRVGADQAPPQREF